MDRNELPEDAAVREAAEEAGIQIELYDADSFKGMNINTDREKVLIRPMHMVWGEIEKGHEHIDFVFYAKSIRDNLAPQANESDMIGWYCETELDEMKDELLEDVYCMAKEAIEVYKAE
ncbi:MAG: NUDIX domain-containing protein [Cellulosilyticaceae bacterium]